MDFYATQHSNVESDIMRKPRFFKIGVIAIFLSTAIIAVGWVIRPFFDMDKIKSESWQAVFLRNDQVYFGRLTLSGDFYILKNVYYLQTEEEQGEDRLAPVSTASVNVSKTKKTSTKLVRLGNELHGPENEMFIERSNVLFWENLKNNSSIVNSINANEKSF